MGSSQSKSPEDEIFDNIFNIRMFIQDLRRQENSSMKEEALLRDKARKCIRKGQIEHAKIHIDNAIHEKRVAVKTIKLAYSLERLARDIERSFRMGSLSESLGEVMDNLSNVINPLETMEQMGNFESVIDNVTLMVSTVDSSVSKGFIKEDEEYDKEVDTMFNQLMDEEGLKLVQDVPISKAVADIKLPDVPNHVIEKKQ